MKGISLSAVLQVINLERQSCDIHARSDGKTGQLHFREGDLVDAVADDLGGEAAAYAILAWDNPEFEVSPQDAPVDRSISTNITTLLLETARRKDERGIGDHDGDDGEDPDGALTAPPALRLATLDDVREPDGGDPAGGRASGTLTAAALKRILTIAKDGLGDALLSADVYSSADGTSLVGFNSRPAACALFNQVTQQITQSLERSGLPALARYYVVELDEGRMMLVAPGGHCRLNLVVDSTQVQLGLLLNVILPEVLAELDGANSR